MTRLHHPVSLLPALLLPALLLPALLLPALLLPACGEAEPHGSTPGGEIVAGECEGSPYERQAVASADTGGEGAEPAVDIAAREGVLLLDYQDLVANCCPSPDFDVVASAGEVVVDLHDVVHGDPCDCMCVMDFAVEVEGLDAGPWHVQARFNGALVGEGDVTL